MQRKRNVGVALLIGIVAPLLIIGMHPTAHDLTADAGPRLVLINHLVHGVALAAQPLLFLGLLGLSRYLGWSDIVTAAVVVYGFGMAAVLSAAVLSGFVAPDVIERLACRGSNA
jgi:hypothetical protein